MTELTLEQLETVVERGLGSYREVGEALRAIRDLALYEGTFDTYVQSRFGMSSGHAYRLIEAARVAELVSIGDMPAPAHEIQCRVLAQVDDPADWWREARERFGPQPMAAQIEQLIYPSRYRREVAELSDVLRWLQELRHPNKADGLRLEAGLECWVERAAPGLERALLEVVRYFTAYAERAHAARVNPAPPSLYAVPSPEVQAVIEAAEAAAG